MLLPNIIKENFFRDDEIDVIANYILKNGIYSVDTITNYSRYNKDQKINPNYFYSWDFNAVTDLYRVLNDKVNELLGKKITGVAAHLATLHVPYYIHSDNWNAGDRGRIPEYTVIIPIETCNSSTIIFNEYVSESVDGVEDNHFANFVKHYDQEKKLKLDARFCSENLSHIHHNDLKCLTLDTVFNWKKGSILLFDRKKFHCSNNFLVKGLTNKTGIVFWTVF